MSLISDWLRQVKIKSKNEFQNWLMAEIGYETYLRNKLWDDASLLHYIIMVRSDNLYETYLESQENLVHVDFSKRGNNDEITGNI